MQNFIIHTRRGRVVFTGKTAEPTILLAHGFARGASWLHGWIDRLPGLAIMRLPGHDGVPELDEISVEAWIEAWQEALGRLPGPHFLIAESLGAVVAMCLPAKAVVAVEPLLSVDQIWPQRRSMEAAGSRVPPAYAALFDHPFDWVLERISAPTLVLAGTEPLLPERPIRTAPSLLTDADFDRYAAHPKVQALRIAGGHTLLDENPDTVQALAARFFEQHGWRPQVQTA